LAQQTQTAKDGGIDDGLGGNFSKTRGVREIGQAMLNLLERILIDWNHL